MTQRTPAAGLNRGASIAIFALALGLRLTLIATTRNDPVFQLPMLDAEYLVEWARGLLESSPWMSPEDDTYFRTPLYAWFLAAAFALPGPDLLIARAIQAVLGSFAVTWLAQIAGRRFSPAAGWATGLLGAAAWPLLYFGRELLIVPLAFFLGAALLRVLDGARPDSGPLRWLSAGILIGLGAVARANFLVALLPAVAWVFVNGRSRAAGRVGLLAAGIALCVAPITIRNLVVSGEPVLLSSQGGLNLWIGNHPEADGMSASVPGFSSWRNEDLEAALARELGHPPSAAEQDTYWRAKFTAALQDRPASFLGGMIRKTYFFLQGYEIRNNVDLYFVRDRNALLRLPLPDFGWVAPLAFVGLIAAWPRRRELIHVSLYALAMAFGVVLFFVCSRYRLPAWPAFLVLAGGGAAAVLGPGVSLARRLTFGGLLVLFAVLLNVDFLGIHHPDASQPHYQLGNVYARSDLDEEAEREFRTALRLQPAFGEARHHLGALLLREGRAAEAVTELERAVPELPGSFRVRRSLAEAYEATGQMERALAVRREAAELSAGAAEDQVALATTLGMAGRHRESFDLFRRLDAEGVAEGSWFHLNAGQSALAVKKEAIGLRWLELAREDPDTRREALLAIASFHLSLGRWDEGQRTLSEALLKDPDDAELLRLRAFARYHSGDPSGALQDLDRVVELDPSDQASRERRRTIRGETGGAP